MGERGGFGGLGLGLAKLVKERSGDFFFDFGEPKPGEDLERFKTREGL